MNYVHSRNPVLDVKLAVSILISSDFLQMKDLVNKTTNYISQNLQEIINLPIDMSCINSQLVAKLASCVDLQVLDQLEDKKDKLRSRLYMKKLELILNEPKALLQRCVSCSSLFNKKQRAVQECEKGRVFVDAHGKALKQHTADESWDLNKFIAFLRAKKLDWKLIFWKLVACTLDFKCSCCNS